jgi:glycosyltransferase involved in cell wall biosynthesis
MPVTRNMVVAVFAPAFPPAYLGGGPIRTLDALVREAPSTVRMLVLTSDRDVGATYPLSVASNEWVSRDSALVYYMSTNRLCRLLRGFAALRREKPTVLYFNSFFSPLFSVLPQLMRRAVFPAASLRLLAPRGEFSVGALAIKRRKKSLFIRLYKALRLHRRLVWHASSSLEAADIRRVWGKEAVILVRENETSLPNRASAPVRQGKSSTLKAFFFGRIVPKKGLLAVLEALQSATGTVELDIYGDEEDARYAQACRRAAARVSSSVTVRFMGAVHPEEVPARFASYDVMLMPTAGENFGHVIAEALSASCPVICTDTTPWTDLLEAGAGRVVRSWSATDWKNAIDSYAALSVDERLELRIAAGGLYEKWWAAPKGPHVLELLSQHCNIEPSVQSALAEKS